MCNLFFVLYCLIFFIYFIKVSESFISRSNIINRNHSLNVICYRYISERRIPKPPQCLRAGKEKFVKELKEQLKNTKAIFQFRSVMMTHKLREHIKENLNKNLDGFDPNNLPYKLRMVKNTLMKIALTGTQFEPLTKNLEKTNFYIFIFDDSIVPKMMSVINGIRKASPITRKCFEPSFGCYNETVFPGTHLRKLSSLPPKEELCKGISPILRRPMYELLNSLSFPSRVLAPINQIFCNLNSTLKQIK